MNDKFYKRVTLIALNLLTQVVTVYIIRLLGPLDAKDILLLLQSTQLAVGKLEELEKEIQ